MSVWTEDLFLLQTHSSAQHPTQMDPAVFLHCACHQPCVHVAHPHINTQCSTNRRPQGQL